MTADTTTYPGRAAAEQEFLTVDQWPEHIQELPRYSRPLRRRWLSRLTGGRWYELGDDPILTSTRQAIALNPALVATHPPQAGAVVGIDTQTGQYVTLDPHELYAQGRITYPNVVVLGVIGSGKSSLLKTQYVLRPLALGRRVAAFDRKLQTDSGTGDLRGEYVSMAERVGGTVIQFSRAAGTRVNLLDPAIAAHGAQGVERSVGQDDLLNIAADVACDERLDT
jgi:hypothetical protein